MATASVESCSRALFSETVSSRIKASVLFIDSIPVCNMAMCAVCSAIWLEEPSFCVCSVARAASISPIFVFCAAAAACSEAMSPFKLARSRSSNATCDFEFVATVYSAAMSRFKLSRSRSITIT